MAALLNLFFLSSAFLSDKFLLACFLEGLPQQTEPRSASETQEVRESPTTRCLPIRSPLCLVSTNWSCGKVTTIVSFPVITHTELFNVITEALCLTRVVLGEPGACDLRALFIKVLNA